MPVCRSPARHFASPGKEALLQPTPSELPFRPAPAPPPPATVALGINARILILLLRPNPTQPWLTLTARCLHTPPLHVWAMFSSLYVLKLHVLFLLLKLLLTLQSPQCNALSSEVQLVHHAMYIFSHKLHLEWFVQCLSSHNVVNREHKMSANRS